MAKMFARVSGAWKRVNGISARQSGTWKSSTAWVRVSGRWERVNVPGWEQLPSLPSGRSLATGVASGATVYVLGGAYPKEILAFDTVTRTWSSPATLGYAHHWAGAGEVAPGRIIIATGNSSSDNETTTCEEYNVTTNTVTTKASAPRKRGWTRGCVYNRSLYLLGGVLHGLWWTGVYETDSYNIDTNSWTYQGKMGYLQYFAGCVNWNNGGVLFAGETSGTSATTRIQHYNAATNTWTAKGSAASSTNYRNIALEAPNTIHYCIGDGLHRFYDLATETETNMPIIKKVEHSVPITQSACAVVDGVAYFLGGSSTYATDASAYPF